MKPRYTIAVLMLLVCLSFFGQQPKTVHMQGQPQKTSTQVSSNQQELIFAGEQNSQHCFSSLPITEGTYWSI